MRNVSKEIMMNVSISPSFFCAQAVEDFQMIWVGILLQQVSDCMELLNNGTQLNGLAPI